MAALSANRALTHSSEDQKKTYTRLATGNRITEAGDDAAGLAISENLRSQIRSMSQAERNANDAISFAQVAEGGMTEIGNMLIRMRELAVQASSDTIGDKERGYINKEVTTLLGEVDRIANSTNYNGAQLLNGQASKSVLEFQVGIRNTDSDRIQFRANDNDVRASTLGVDGLDYSSIDNARESLDKVDKAMDKVFAMRASLGAVQNKLVRASRTRTSRPRPPSWSAATSCSRQVSRSSPKPTRLRWQLSSCSELIRQGARHPPPPSRPLPEIRGDLPRRSSHRP
jgi:flagellin